MANNFFDIISSPDGSGQVGGQSYILGRVAHIVYGPYYPGTTTPDPNYKNPTDLGKILFEILNGTQSSTFNSLGNEPAKPLYSWMKQYPTEGEYVHIVTGPSLGLNENTNQKSYYYLPPFNLWGAVNHNALPNLIDYNEHVNAVKVNYQQNKITNQTSNLTTGSGLVLLFGGLELIVVVIKDNTLQISKPFIVSSILNKPDCKKLK